eukprot:3096575-Prymnesium_polylepis.1
MVDGSRHKYDMLHSSMAAFYEQNARAAFNTWLGLTDALLRLGAIMDTVSDPTLRAALNTWRGAARTAAERMQDLRRSMVVMQNEGLTRAMNGWIAFCEVYTSKMTKLHRGVGALFGRAAGRAFNAWRER